MFFPGGGGYGRVDFHALCCDPLKCDSSVWQNMVHRFLVTSPHPPPCFMEEGGVSVKSRSTSLPAVSTRCRLPPFNTAQIAIPGRHTLVYHRPVTLLMDNLSSTSLHISSKIHKFWRAAHFSRFGMVRRNSAKIFSALILVYCLGSQSGKRMCCLS